MKILHANDMAADSLFGGAEYNAYSVCELLRSMGHTVDDFGMRKVEGSDLIQSQLPPPVELDYDVMLIGQWNILDPRWILKATEANDIPMVLWLHATPWCKDFSCSCGGRVDPHHKGCRVPLYWELIRRAKAVLAYSPAQIEKALCMFGMPPTRDHYKMLPIFCDRAEEFYAHRNDEREPGSCISVARHSKAKGAVCYSIFAQTNKHHMGPFRAIGRYAHNTRELYEDAGIECLERAPLEELPALLGRHEYFYHQPPQIDTGPRTIVEARLAGCKVLTASTCGYTSHPMWKMSDEELVARTKMAPMAVAEVVLSNA